jgi:hypothetical protein
MYPGTALKRFWRSGQRRVPPGNLSARSIQFGIAVAPSLPQELQRMRTEGWHRGIVRPGIHIDRVLVLAALAGHEQAATDALPAHAAERHRANWFVVPSHGRSKNGHGKFHKGTFVALSGSRLRAPQKAPKPHMTAAPG